MSSRRHKVTGNMIEEELKGLAFTDGEIRAYLALVHLGASTVGNIIKRSQISSSKVYLILNKLISKGLVSSVIKNEIRVFKAQEPYRLLDFIETQERELKERKKRIYVNP